jgi:hypothetical protein
MPSAAGTDPASRLAGGELLDLLRQLEIELHSFGTDIDPARLEVLLHRDFEEIGRSGRRYAKADVLRELAERRGASRGLSGSFELTELADGLALLTYQTAQVDEEGKLFQCTLRSSLWMAMPVGWQLRFHQGTAVGTFDG